MINKAILIGRLGKDPEVRTLDSGTQVAKFSIATTEKFKDSKGEVRENTEWHYIIGWKNLAVFAEKYLVKGDSVYVEGKITHRKWKDSNGVERETTEIIAQEIRKLNWSENNKQAGDKEAEKLANENSKSSSNFDDNTPDMSDDLPF